jgi:hypothetical protein
MVHNSKALRLGELGPISRADLGLLNKYDPEYAPRSRRKGRVRAIHEHADGKEQRLKSIGFWKVMADARSRNKAIRNNDGFLLQPAMFERFVGAHERQSANTSISS